MFFNNKKKEQKVIPDESKNEMIDFIKSFAFRKRASKRGPSGAHAGRVTVRAALRWPIAGLIF